jgi:hypothetical protein
LRKRKTVNDETGHDTVESQLLSDCGFDSFATGVRPLGMPKRPDQKLDHVLTNKRVNALVDDTLKYRDLVDEHLMSCPEDLILLILTGHLVVEELLEMVLASVLALETLPKNERGESLLKFNDKFRLAQAVVCVREPGPNADMFCVIGKLNNVRNRVGHKLKKQPEIEKLVLELLKTYYEKTGKKPDNKQTLPTLLRVCLADISRFLIKVRLHFYRLENSV